MVEPGGQVDRSPVSEVGRRELEAALRRAMRGGVSFDGGTRAVYATDSSNYRQVPLGVVFPLDHDDVVAALRVCAEYDAPFLARGAGTSLAGQACNVAVVLDTSRHMTKILAIDPVARTARVQPGVVLDDLRRAADPYGLTFGPDPATHAWCTLGGMIGNNSCGSHALYAGKTVENVERLTVVEYGGASYTVGACDEADYAAAVSGGGRLAEVLTGLRDVGRRHADLVRARFPDIPRRVSGYNLDQLLPENGFHVARALVGTESTCAAVTEAVVRLSVSPRHRRLVVLGYPDVFAAADAVPELLRHPLLALEGFDGTLVDQMRARPLNVEHLALLPDGRGWLLAELGADEPAEADALAEAFVADLPAEVTWRRYDDAERQGRVWLVRESGLGATAITADGTRNHEGWEDAAVAPEHLGTYLRAITALWAEFGYSGAWYGHFGQGCVHTRNDFDFSSVAGLADYRRFVERAADLVVSLGGSLSGEHGDGQSRGELLERMYGPELVDAFRQFKAVFDPRGRMNPGKLIDAYPLDTNLRYGPAYRPESLGRSQLVFGADGPSLQKAAERCVGVGRCRRDDAGTMCPSYRATRDERHSTRGRARLLVELFQGETTPATWRNEDVREALDLCLSCKGCAVDCPTGVDMASYKAEFMSHYYAGRMRPRGMSALAYLPWIARATSRTTWLPNAVLGAPGVGWAVRRMAGITTARPAPLFARRPFRRDALAAACRDDLAATVVVWPDTFTDAFRPDIADDLVAVLRAVGERIAVPSSWACCGRPLYDAGMLGLARRTLTRLLDVLEPWTSRGIPVVVPEPSCLAAFRVELPALLADDPRAAVLASLARSPSEHLLAAPGLEAILRDPRRAEREDDLPARAVVHPHCHGRAIGTPAADRELLGRLGFTAGVLDAGCCGMAGSFGYRSEHEPLSRQIGLEQWLPRVRGALGPGGEETLGPGGATALLVDGVSCRMQLDQLSDLRSTTLISFVRRALRC
ncbi:MAG TPA: FAD-binding and (Fe-S)-binding domain-containing protein [Patescibacteria group bacterium]|nr:FAD-binding and (Fe-S)-binding domain-containing protein [Patescibacteria group bacterium]